MKLVVNASPIIFLSKIEMIDYLCKAARNCAQSFQIPVIGTIGLIIHAKQNQIINDAKPYLLKLKDTGFRINDQLFDYALKLAD